MKKIVIAALSLILIGAGAFLIVRYALNLRSAQELYDGADAKYVDYDDNDDKYVITIEDDDYIPEKVESKLELPEENDTEKEEKEVQDTSVYSFRYSGPWDKQIDVDIKSLCMQYPDVKGWLFFENEDISYPIVQGDTDDKYIRMAYNGEATPSGSIFVESKNASDFSDAHTIIYGHNMRNRTMFGALRKYSDRAKYYGYHKYFQIIHVGSEGQVIKTRYEIFAYGKAKSFSKIYTVCHEHDAAFQDTLQYLQGSLYMPEDIPVYVEDSVVTLSTCAIGEKRMLVSAVKVDEVVVE